MIDLGLSLGVRVPQGEASRLGLKREGIHAYLPETRDVLAFLEKWKSSPLLLSHERDRVRRLAEILRGKLDGEPNTGVFVAPPPRRPGPPPARASRGEEEPYDISKHRGQFTGNREAALYWGAEGGRSTWKKMTREERQAKIRKMCAARQAKRKRRVAVT